MNRRSFLRGVTASGALLAGANLAGIERAFAQQNPPKTGKRPNIIFILADDWGWGDLGVHGNAVIKTPNLDRMARAGTSFSNAYVASPVCSPARAAFMTGRYPARLRIHGHFSSNDKPEINARRAMPNWLDPTVPTVSRLLQGGGYATAHFGKWHLGGGPGAPLPAAYGFDAHRTFNSNDEGTAGAMRSGPTAATQIVDATIAFARQQQAAGKPFYVNAWLHDTHTPIRPTPQQLAAYPNLPENSPLRIYNATATDSDFHIGRLLDFLDQSGLSQNTLVVFSSDNGPEDQAINQTSVGSAGPFRGRKRSIYEGGIRVPFIVQMPGTVPANRVDNQTVICGVDWLPSMCAFTGAPLPATVATFLDGQDVSPAWKGRAQTVRRPLFWEWRFKIFGAPFHKSPQLAMREGDWKLLMNPDRSRIELFNLKNDRGETDNLADRHPAVVAALSPKLLAWHAQLPPGPLDAEAGRNDTP